MLVVLACFPQRESPNHGSRSRTELKMQAPQLRLPPFEHLSPAVPSTPRLCFCPSHVSVQTQYKDWKAMHANVFLRSASLYLTASIHFFYSFAFPFPLHDGLRTQHLIFAIRRRITAFHRSRVATSFAIPHICETASRQHGVTTISYYATTRLDLRYPS